MVRSWMDAVICFAVVGITFEFLENIVFGLNSDFLSALMRSIAAAHTVFGVIMGYFYGKYRVTGEKKPKRFESDRARRHRFRRMERRQDHVNRIP